MSSAPTGRTCPLFLVTPMLSTQVSNDAVKDTANSEARVPREIGEIVGIWDLVSMCNEYPDGSVLEPLGSAPTGKLIYTSDGSMGVQLGNPKRARVGVELTELLVFKQVPRQPWKVFVALGRFAAFLRLLFAGVGYVAYTGKFSFSDGVVFHEVQGALFPDWEATVQRREASFDAQGNLVLLARHEALVQRVVWRRNARMV